MRVLLATSAELPQGEPGAAVLDDVLRARGIDAVWARWDDPAVDWAAADVVAVRSTWDYVHGTSSSSTGPTPSTSTACSTVPTSSPGTTTSSTCST